MTNILILSAGTRNKIVRYFKETLTIREGKRNGYVVAADMSRLAPSVYEADRFYQVSAVTEPGYLNEVFEICRKEKISAVLSLIDPELGLLSDHEAEFSELGVSVIGSRPELCDMSLDKMQMYQWLTEHGYQTAKSYTDKETFFADIAAGKIFYPAFVKPRTGSASISVCRAEDEETVKFLLKHGNDLLVQECLEGQEIGADIYVDMISKEMVSAFTKKKIAMRAGETDKAVSFQDERLFELLEKFVKEAGYEGVLDVDLFEIDGEYYISEVNPRFGGGYPHAHESGCNHVKMLVNNLRGIVNKRSVGAYEEGIYMMKYNETSIRKFSSK
ncbi:MAG: ATP-grasp domain-containing protein [Lachnospiraceae bacterium]|nr:ATP-grasp domain-containing protein [Lachnospiraceae bacterium]